MPHKRRDLKCFHGSAQSDWLRLGPMKIQVNSRNPFHAVIKELLYHHECDRIQTPLAWMLDERNKEQYGTPQYSFEWTDIRVMKKYEIPYFLYDTIMLF